MNNSYTVIARRYRPQVFDDVIGQEYITTTIKNAITENKVAHAYIFAGTRGVGKTSLARKGRPLHPVINASFVSLLPTVMTLM